MAELEQRVQDLEEAVYDLVVNPAKPEYTASKRLVRVIKGAKGESVKGDQGDRGKSAYEIWQDLGNKGTEKDFIRSLRGKDGHDGQTTIETITKEIPVKGVDGEDGKSAYEIWLELGNKGTKQDFIDSLKGERGASGGGGTAQRVLNVVNNRNYRIVDQDYAIRSGDYYIEVTASSKTVTLPSASGKQGVEYHVDNSSSGDVTVTPVCGSDLILNQDEGTYLVSNGSQWRVK